MKITQGIKRILFFGLGLVATSSFAQGYSMQVITAPAEVRFVDGEVRFCPVAGLKGNICRQEVNFFGKRRMEVIDWWRPGTYVSAATGLQNPVVIQVDQLGNGQLAIRYQAN